MRGSQCRKYIDKMGMKEVVINKTLQIEVTFEAIEIVSHNNKLIICCCYVLIYKNSKKVKYETIH